MFRFIYIIAAFLMISAQAQAQYMNLTADKEVEWDSLAQKMTAVGNAVASKKDLQIRADKMTAYYAKNSSAASKKNSITEVHAEGGVVVTTPKAKAYGQTMDYDLTKDSVILKGEPAKIQTEKETITAKDNITYYPSQEKAVATGNVIATDKQNNKIYSDKMIAFFEKNAQTGNMEMNKIEFYDNIKIVTDKASVTADKGVYLPQTGIIKLYDHVFIDQQGNKLQGDFAETNLNTGKSRIIAGKTSQGRVSGVFKQKSQK